MAGKHRTGKHKALQKVLRELRQGAKLSQVEEAAKLCQQLRKRLQL